MNHEARLRFTRDRSQVNLEVRANETYSEAKRQFSVRNRDVLMNALSPHQSSVVVHSKVCCVRLEFVITTACWWELWTGGIKQTFEPRM